MASKSRRSLNRAKKAARTGAAPKRDFHAQNAAAMNRSGGAGRHTGNTRKEASRRACRGRVRDW